MTAAKKKVEEIIRRIAEKYDAYVVDVNVVLQGTRTFIRGFVQNIAGITMDEIAQLSREIHAVEELDRLFPEGYNLEISSPGIDAKLTQYRDFPRNIGRRLKVYHHATGLKSPLVGKLIQADETHLELNIDGDDKRLPLRDLDYAKVKIEW